MPILPAEIPGFVWAYRFMPGHSAVRLSSETTLEELGSGDGFVWLHLNLVDIRVAAFLDKFEGLTEPCRTALTNHETHASITVDEQMLYGTLVDFQREFDAETRDIGWLHFAISDRFI